MTNSIKNQKEIKNYNINIEFFKKGETLDNRAIGCGVYVIEILKKCDTKATSLYIGQSLTVLKRGGEHLYELFKNIDYLGLTEENMNDSNLILRFRILESCKPEERYSKEKQYIGSKYPILQSGLSDRMKDIDKKRDAIRALSL